MAEEKKGMSANACFIFFQLLWLGGLILFASQYREPMNKPVVFGYDWLTYTCYNNYSVLGGGMVVFSLLISWLINKENIPTGETLNEIKGSVSWVVQLFLVVPIFLLGYLALNPAGNMPTGLRRAEGPVAKAFESTEATKEVFYEGFKNPADSTFVSGVEQQTGVRLYGGRTRPLAQWWWNGLLLTLALIGLYKLEWISKTTAYGVVVLGILWVCQLELIAFIGGLSWLLYKGGPTLKDLPKWQIVTSLCLAGGMTIWTFAQMYGWLETMANLPWKWIILVTIILVCWGLYRTAMHDDAKSRAAENAARQKKGQSRRPWFWS